MCYGLFEVKHLVCANALLEFLFCVHKVGDTVNKTEDYADTTATSKKDVDDATLNVTEVELVNT